MTRQVQETAIAVSTPIQRLRSLLRSHEGRTVFALAFMAGVFATIYKSLDNAMVHRYIVLPSDDLTAASVYLIIGAWVGVLTRIPSSYFLGRWIDKDFRGLFAGSSPRMHKFALIAGAFGAISTLATLSGAQGVDPGVMIALGSFQVAFLGYFDRKKGQTMNNAWLFISITLVGCVLASVQGSGEFPWKSILLILLVATPLNGISSHFGQEGGRAGDSVSYSFWRFVWLATIGTVGVIVLAMIRGKLSLLGHGFHMAITSVTVLLVVSLVMLFVFFNDTLETQAKKIAMASIAYVFLISQGAQILLGNPSTIIGNQISRGIFGEIPDWGYVWILRVIGTGLVAWGVLALKGKRLESRESVP